MRPFETSAEFFFSLFLASHYLKPKTLAKVLLLRYNPYTILAFMRSLYMRSHLDHLFRREFLSEPPISLRGERPFMTTYLTTYVAKIEKLGREKVARNKSILRKPAQK